MLWPHYASSKLHRIPSGTQTSAPPLSTHTLGRLAPTGSGGTSLQNWPLWYMMVRISLHIPVCVMLTIHSQHGRSRANSTSCTGAPFALHISSRSHMSSSKRKEPEVLVDSLPHWRAKASGSLRGMKQHVPSPAPAGPQDVDEDLPSTSELPEVQVERPLSQQGSEDLQARSESIAIGEVCVTYPYHLHLLTTQIGSL